MDRRSFVISAGALALGSINRKERVHDLVCSPPNMYGVQNCEAGILADVLDVTASDTQHASEWCWAACIEGVFSYYGHAVPQERIVSEAWGRIVNQPGSPSMILSSLNRTWTDESGDRFRVSASIIGTTPAAAAQDLADNHPLIIGTLGHAMLLTSLVYQRSMNGNGGVVLAKVRDPWPYNPRRRALTPQEWYSISFAARIRVSDVGSR